MNYKSVYFIGIGGIGMSNLARYFMATGLKVGGYDKTETVLTKQLQDEGAFIHYEDDINKIPCDFLDVKNTLIVFTPAVPYSHQELTFFKENGFQVVKRSQALGEITKSSKSVCVAGTHGKTTVSSMVAHILHQSKVNCSAFLGGILKNYNSNLILSDNSSFTVVEADEYDRSFHWLYPWIAIITSADPDHLDIYGTPESYREGFEHFTSLISENGYLILKKGCEISPKTQKGVTTYIYSQNEGDFHAENIRIGNGEIIFDFIYPDGIIKDIKLGVPVRINIENAVAAMAASYLCGATEEECRNAIVSFSGTKRRFDIILKNEKIVFIDDYAHHPKELIASINSVKELYPDKKITGVFQPHLYSRTRDFATEFAESLSHLDDVILLDIYPAREEPIPGVTSQIIFDRIDNPNKTLINFDELINTLKNKNIEVLLTIGAGNIDTKLPEIKSLLENKYL